MHTHIYIYIYIYIHTYIYIYIYIYWKYISSIGNHWIALYLNGWNVTYFDSIGVELVSKKLKISWATQLLQKIFIE